MRHLVLLVCLWVSVHGFPSGAPEKACGDMTPVHYVAGGPQTTPSPYSLVVSETNNFKVTITGKYEYEGLLLKAKNVGDSKNTSIGNFFNLPTNTRTACNDSAVTHASNKPAKSNLTFDWQPPKDYCGNFVYEATVAENYLMFWTHNLSPSFTIPCTTAPPPPPTPNTTSTTNTTSTRTTTAKPLTLDPECGSTKKCFSDCQASGCTFVVTWRQVGQEVEFEITSKMSGTVPQYAAIAFSYDKVMSGDSVIGCLDRSGTVSVENSYNAGYYNTPIQNKYLGLTLISGSADGTLLRCKFRRNITVIGDAQIFDLSHEYYLFFAAGPLNSGFTISKHVKHPSISLQKMSFADVPTTTTSTTTKKPTTSAPITTPMTTTTTSTTKSAPVAITLDTECNKTKSCFHDCSAASSCTYLVTWKSAGSDVEFEIAVKLTKTGDQWIGIGFSSDAAMGDDSVIACLNQNGIVTAQYSYNPGHYNTGIVNKTRNLILISGSFQDSILRCKIRRPAIYIDEPKIFNLDQMWYLFVANGQLFSGSLGKHTDYPHISLNKLTFAAVSGSTTTTTTAAGPFTLTMDPECGKSKECFHDCNQSGCTFLVTWHAEGQNVEFEIIAKMAGNGEQWAGIGFSNDTSMGNDYVVACVYKGGQVVVEQSYNPDHYNQKLANTTLGLTHATGSTQDMYIKCHFERPAVVANEAKIFDLTKTWYLMFAKGYVSFGHMNKHASSPIVSSSRRTFLSSTTTDSTTPSISVSQTVSSQTTTKPQTGVITSDAECSKSKGCFDDCQNGQCSYQITWRDSKDSIEFQIKAVVPVSGNYWSAIGFSGDNKMGGDNVIACLHKSGLVTVQQSYNPGYYNQPISDPTVGLIIKSATLQNSVIECVFQRKKNITTEPKLFDLNKKWYLLYATGTALHATSLGKHSSMPKASPGTVDFLVAESVKGTEKDYTLVKVHGCLMMIAWIFFASVGIVSARYYKTHWPDSRLLGEKIWFTIHRTSMVFVLLCTCVAFIIIFVEIGGYSEIIPEEGLEYIKYHPILGIVVTCLTVINPIMALFRPAPDHKRRPIFNILHWFVGTSALILAVITIFFGLQFEKSGAPVTATYVMIAYCATFVLIEIILEVHRCTTLRRHNASNTYEMKENGDPSPTDTRVESYKKNATFKTWLLYLHVVAMLIFTVTLVLLLVLSEDEDGA